MKPYMPSNGSEGECFHEEFCYRCEFGGAEGTCEIWLNGLIGEQPKEWVQDEGGLNPRCTAFHLEGTRSRVCDVCGISADSIEPRNVLVDVCEDGAPHRWKSGSVARRAAS